jgi:IS5 family transposase
LGTRSRFPGAVRGLRRVKWRLGSLLVPRTRAFSDDAAGFASCCGPASCSPPCRGFVAPLRRRALTRRREPCYRGPWHLPGPDLHRLAAVSLSLGYAIPLLSYSASLGARAAGRTLPPEKGWVRRAAELRKRLRAAPGSWLNDTVVVLLPPHPLEVTVVRESDSQTTIWELLLPEELKRLPSELARVDAYLDDERFIAPFRALFDRRLGRPSVPVESLLQLLYLKHRYQLGYEGLCREVSDSIGWRRFCRIGLEAPVPHPTTLVKLVRRAGPETIAQLNGALLDKLTGDRLLRRRKLRVDTIVVEADIDYPTDADLLEQAVRKLGGLVRRIKAQGVASRTAFRDRRRAAGRRMKQLARTLRRRTGVAMAEVDRLTGQVAGIAKQTVRQVQAVDRNARRALARRPGDRRLLRLVDELQESIGYIQRLLWQTDQRLAGNQVIADRLVSLSDPDARPIRKGSPSVRPSSATPAGGRGRAWVHRRPPAAAGQSAGCSPAGPCNPAGRSGYRPGAGHCRRRPWIRYRRQRPRSGRAGRGATAPQARRDARWSEPDPSAECELAGRDRGADQPSQAWLRIAPQQAASAGRCQDLGRAGRVRLQPAAHDGDRPVSTGPGHRHLQQGPPDVAPLLLKDPFQGQVASAVHVLACCQPCVSFACPRPADVRVVVGWRGG